MIHQKTLQHGILMLALACLLVLAIGCADGEEVHWWEGGTLHNATVTQWKSATYENKLATAGDWLAATKWEGHLKSTDDFDKLKLKSQMLVNAVDEVANAKKTESLTGSMKISEIAAAIITMSNDLGP